LYGGQTGDGFDGNDGFDPNPSPGTTARDSDGFDGFTYKSKPVTSVTRVRAFVFCETTISKKQARECGVDNLWQALTISRREAA